MLSENDTFLFAIGAPRLSPIHYSFFPKPMLHSLVSFLKETECPGEEGKSFASSVDEPSASVLALCGWGQSFCCPLEFPHLWIDSHGVSSRVLEDDLTPAIT